MKHRQYIDSTMQTGFVLLLIADDCGSASYWVSRLKCEVTSWLLGCSLANGAETVEQGRLSVVLTGKASCFALYQCVLLLVAVFKIFFPLTCC